MTNPDTRTSTKHKVGCKGDSNLSLAAQYLHVATTQGATQNPTPTSNHPTPTPNLPPTTAPPSTSTPPDTPSVAEQHRLRQLLPQMALTQPSLTHDTGSILNTETLTRCSSFHVSSATLRRKAMGLQMKSNCRTTRMTGSGCRGQASTLAGHSFAAEPALCKQEVRCSMTGAGLPGKDMLGSQNNKLRAEKTFQWNQHNAYSVHRSSLEHRAEITMAQTVALGSPKGPSTCCTCECLS